MNPLDNIPLPGGLGFAYLAGAAAARENDPPAIYKIIDMLTPLGVQPGDPRIADVRLAWLNGYTHGQASLKPTGVGDAASNLHIALVSDADLAETTAAKAAETLDDDLRTLQEGMGS